MTEDGEKQCWQRDEEFETYSYNREKLPQLWENGWHTLFATLSSLEPGDLEKTIHIRTQPFKVIDAINRQLTHYAYHVG